MASVLDIATGSVPGTPQRINLNSSVKTVSANSMAISSTTSLKRNTAKAPSAVSIPTFNKSDIVPVIVPRTSIRSDMTVDSRKEVGVGGRTVALSLQSKATDSPQFSNRREEMDKLTISQVSESTSSKVSELSSIAERNIFPAVTSSNQGFSTAERISKDERCVGTLKHEMSSMREPTANTQPESSMYLLP